ncbi:MAG TPA: aldo/keto reductase [Candidatus Brocadiia bacterium]|nr:aldo/keto reductase [Candidatus Brocadiia bacterium]
MRYAPLGKTGLSVSRLGFGAMRLLMDGKNVDFDQATRLMRRAFDLGVNFVDSQYHYCGDQSETAVGKAVAGRRDQVIIQTKAAYYDQPKYGPWEDHRARLEETLRRLSVDYLDIYLMHSLDMTKWKQYGEGWMNMARKAKEQGLIRHIGLSAHDTPENIIALLDTGCFETILLQYNMLDTRNEKALAHARAKGIGTMVMGPVGGGRLAGPPPEWAGRTGGCRTSAELALRFVLSNPDVDCAFSGMRSEAEIEENCAVASRKEALTAGERKLILGVIGEKQRLAQVYCSGCGYCQPCPQDVPIPHLLSALAMDKVWGLKEAARARYARLNAGKTPGAPAPVCVECGQCLPKCPQKIDIPARLREAREALGS